MTVFFIFDQIENMEVPTGKPIQIEKALQILNRQNDRCLNEEWKASCAYSIQLNEGIIYSSSLKFPYESFSLYTIIESEMKESSDIGENEEQFLNWLQGVTGEPIKAKKEKIVKEKKLKEPKGPKEKKQKIQKEPREPRHIKLNPKLIIGGVGLVLIVTIAIAATLFFNQKPTYSDLMKKQDYLTAGKLYPEKVEEIENEIFNSVSANGSEAIQDLKDFNKVHKSILGTFDLAVIEHDFTRAIEIFEKDKKAFSNLKNRLILVGYSYLKQGDLKKAEEINQEINSTELEQYIYKFNQLTLFIKEKEKDIEQMQKDPIKNQQAIEKAIDSLFEAKDNLENL